MTINQNIFSKCAPAISTNIKQCGSVTVCNAQPLTQNELETTYMKSGDYRVMDALIKHDFEIKMCEAVQNGMYDFLMANKQNWSKKLSFEKPNSGEIAIAPFVKGRQYSPINNEYWKITSGHNTNAIDGLIFWQVNVTSTTNIPADVRSFPTRQRVFIDGKTAGNVATKTAWEVAEVIDNHDNTLTLLLKSQNTNSSLSAAKLTVPQTGIMRRGTPNVSDFEKFCAEPPAYLNWKNVPFWVETTRTTMCKSSLYDQWRELVIANNPLYKEFGDLPDIEKNKQLANDWQRRLVNQMFWGKALPYQNPTEYDQLEQIISFNGGDFGVDGGKCIGKRANAVGVYEQLASCGRVTDLAGGKLYLLSLFQELYNMMRVRQGNGANNAREFDIFTDSGTASILNLAMLEYYKAQAPSDTFRLNYDIKSNNQAKKAEFGFFYQSYPLNFPQGVTINIIFHEFFDDYITAAATNDVSGSAYANTARVLWILDFPGIYPGIIASKRITAATGDLSKMAALNPDFACVMQVHTQEQTLTSMTYTMVVECPKSNLIIENFAIDVGSNLPNVTVVDPTFGTYPPTTTTTTTTTVSGAGIFKNTAQTYTAECPNGTAGDPNSVTIAAQTAAYNSYISQSDANAKAMAAAKAQAEAGLSCA